MPRAPKQLITPESEDDKWAKQRLSTYEKSIITSALHSLKTIPDTKDLNEMRITKLALDVCREL